MDTIVDVLDTAFERFADQPALALRRDDGGRMQWTYRELARRSRLAAWRLHALGLEPGDRILTWSPSGPELAAAYFGAIRARLILVPLDLRMSPEAISNIFARAAPRRLLLGGGRDGPDPARGGLEGFPASPVESLCAEPDETFPSDWQAQLDAWPRPEPSDIWDLIFTSGTTGAPKGVMIAHDNWLATMSAIDRIIPHLHHRVLSILPMSHLFEQGIGLTYALSVGADILYVRSLSPRVLTEAMREQRVTTMIVVPQVLDLFWSAIEREADRSGRAATFERLRRIARHLPYAVRRRAFGRVHERFGGSLQLFVSSGAFLPPALQQAWEDLGVIVMQGYGSTENGFGTCNSREDHGLGTVGRPVAPVELSIADDGEVLFRGPTLFKGYWRDPEATARAIDPEGWYHTGDIGHLDAAGRLVLSGRTKDRIVLPNGFNVYPEDVENALRNAGIRDAVVVETRPGRLEAVILTTTLDSALGDASAPAGAPRPGPDGAQPSTQGTLTEAVRARVDAAIRSANAQLGPNQRVADWRAWPERDFPRTHTLKVRRGEVRAWATGERGP